MRNQRPRPILFVFEPEPSRNRAGTEPEQPLQTTAAASKTPPVTYTYTPLGDTIEKTISTIHSAKLKNTPFLPSPSP